MNRLISTFMLLAFAINLSAQTPDFPFWDSNLPQDQRIEDLLQRLTLEEKIAMMQNASKGVERLGIPDYDWWNEALHGVARSGKATVFPQAIGLAATFDPDEHLKTFTIISDEPRATLNAARKSIVLLKNDNVLPLKPEKTKRIAVIGPNAADGLVEKAGDYSILVGSSSSDEDLKAIKLSIKQ